jgi:cytochrome c biogenesis protein CcmG/thiol:disulfide interchange protein DsbE
MSAAPPPETATPSGPVSPPAPSRRGWAERFGATSRTAKISLVIAAVAIVAAIVASAFPGGHSPAHSAGPPPLAKPFSLATVGHPGQHVSLAAYAGRPVIVNFFASWCEPCQQETPLLARFYRQSGGRVTVLGVDSNDATANAERFMRKAGVQYPVGADPYPASTTTSYGVYGLPQTFFLNASHHVVSHIAGALTMKDLTSGVAKMRASS